MSDLVAFLKERLDEDERTARAATPGPWHWDLYGGAFDGEDRPDGAEEWGHCGPDLVAGPDRADVVSSTGYDADNVIVSRADAAHIARWDPSRVLAEVAAKRRIVDEHPPAPATGYLRATPDAFGCRTCHVEEGYVEPHGWCTTLRLLASCWSSHPGYDPTWQVTATLNEKEPPTVSP